MRTPRRTFLVFLLVAAAALAAALLLDHWAFVHAFDRKVYDRDWGRMLRVVGFLPLWIAAAAALALEDRGAPREVAGAWYRRALLLLGAPAAAGIAGEVLKLVIRRERPGAHDGASVFRPFAERPLSTAGLATPSSHAIVAFGAAFILARLFPRAAPIWYFLAAGCALTRVLARAHFLSDVVLSAILAWLVVAALWRGWGAPRPAGAVPEPTAERTAAGSVG
jgi:membrane-associated phospholipid phosphatase